MAISLVTLIAACLCAATLVPSRAVAANERITFSGAVVEPTCGISSVDSAAAAANAAGTHFQVERWACIKHGSASREASPSYTLTVMRLSGSISDPVLKYFETYVLAGRSDVAGPVLLTQTYE